MFSHGYLDLVPRSDLNLARKSLGLLTCNPPLYNVNSTIISGPQSGKYAYLTMDTSGRDRTKDKKHGSDT